MPRPPKYPWRTLALNESFIVPDIKTRAQRMPWQARASIAGTRTGRRFTVWNRGTDLIIKRVE